MFWLAWYSLQVLCYTMDWFYSTCERFWNENILEIFLWKIMIFNWLILSLDGTDLCWYSFFLSLNYSMLPILSYTFLDIEFILNFDFLCLWYVPKSTIDLSYLLHLRHNIEKNDKLIITGCVKMKLFIHGWKYLDTAIKSW